ncbi:hypothetical protein S40285_03934 [Stachybotrys chlorohalonatus IBT 40285]|uniref:NADAR domain-containing protein n=1 Tax=Stachybotrys chlorohalonatus (strain IBT 40285) TaxID=1283841 RepID=A0A084R150_STAC4|nr:hypothetical protein S40285_03934 [Stachybotrys chlorohalonata IBT 40285]
MTPTQKQMRTSQSGRTVNRTEDVKPQAQQEPLFYMPDAEFGEFCQWYPSTFTVTNKEISDLIGHEDGEPEIDFTFTCAEQFMMFCKAARFHDTPPQAQIMATASQKSRRSSVVEAGNTAKFGQNTHLMRKLFATGDRLLCEAASRDSVWGIGYTAKHAMSHRKHWGEIDLFKR